MTKLSLEAKGLDEAKQRLRDMLERCEDPQPGYALAAQDMLLFVEERFQTETAPDGSPWAELQPETLRNRLPGKILQQTSALRNANWAKGTSEGVQFGNASPYAAPQHYGRDDADHPGRPWYPVTPDGDVWAEPGTPAGDLLDDMAESLRAWLQGPVG